MTDMTDMKNHSLEHTAPIIGYHRAPLSQKFGAPRQPNLVPLLSVIEMIAPFDTPAAFVGLSDFSHIWLSWQFHHNFMEKANSSQQTERDSNTERDIQFRAQVRPPRLGGNSKVGVFASRSMYRPSGLGLSVVKLERVDSIAGRVLLLISGADMIDGTPIIDIKPYVAYSDAIPNAKSGFADAAPIGLSVTITQCASAQFKQLIRAQACHDAYSKSQATVTDLIYDYQSRLIDQDIEHIKALVAQDPRPAYHRDSLNKPFIMRYKSVDISFRQIEPEQLQITEIIEVRL